jgi:phasin
MATATNTKSTKSAKPAAGAFDAFAFPASTLEVPVAFRDAAEKSVTQIRDSYEQVKTAAEDTSTLVEDTLATVRDGALGIGEKALEAVQNNNEASLALVRDLASAKTVADAVELQTTFARKQFDIATEQFKVFQDLSQSLFDKTTKPVAEKVEKTLKEFNVA